jgi:hypothetical protein
MSDVIITSGLTKTIDLKTNSLKFYWRWLKAKSFRMPLRRRIILVSGGVTFSKGVILLTPNKLDFGRFPVCLSFW